MKRDLISIIVPVYNAESHLCKCVDSILNQTYEDIEIILINDGSVDASKDICETYASHYHNITAVHQKNEGVSSARNHGIRIAKGSYIMFIDSDDYVEPNYCENLITIQIKYEDKCFVLCGFRSYYGKEVRKFDYIFDCDTHVSVINRKAILLLWKKGLLNPPYAKLYIKKVIEEHHLQMNHKIDIGEDLLFNLNYLEALGDKDIIVINKALYNYYIGQMDSLSSKFNKNYFEVVKLLNSEMLSACQRWCVEDIVLYYRLAWIYYIEVMTNRFSKGNKENLVDKLKYNQTIIRSNEYKSVVNRMINSLSIGEKLVCKSNFSIILILTLKALNYYHVLRKRL